VVVGMSGASSAADGPEVTYSTVRGRCQSIHGSISHIYISGSIASCYLLSALPGCSNDASLMVRLDDHLEFRQPVLTLDAAGPVK